jgi:hypothetical protein
VFPGFVFLTIEHGLFARNRLKGIRGRMSKAAACCSSLISAAVWAELQILAFDDKGCPPTSRAAGVMRDRSMLGVPVFSGVASRPLRETQICLVTHSPVGR